jgi:hypothetical protein
VRLLGEVPVDPGEVAGLVRQRAVLVLSDVTLPPPALPVAAGAFRLDRRAAAAKLVGIAVAAPLAPAGPGPPAAHWCADAAACGGVQAGVHACAVPGGVTASLLAAAGFIPPRLARS